MVLGGDTVMLESVGEERKVVDGFGEGLVREGCRGLPVVTNKSIYFHDFDYISYCSVNFEVVPSS